MVHAKTFNEFIPSIEEAKLYVREWRNGNSVDRQHYLRLAVLFSTHPVDRLAQCRALNAAYNCLMFVSVEDAVNHLMSIPNLDKRLNDGDSTLIGEIAQINDRQQYVFATMYCHHSNPNTYFGYSNPVGNCLRRLNDLDGFYEGAINYAILHNYPEYTKIMRSLEKFYHLECLSKLEMDIMLREANNL